MLSETASSSSEPDRCDLESQRVEPKPGDHKSDVSSSDLGCLNEFDEEEFRPESPLVLWEKGVRFVKTANITGSSSVPETEESENEDVHAFDFVVQPTATPSVVDAGALRAMHRTGRAVAPASLAATLPLATEAERARCFRDEAVRAVAFDEVGDWKWRRGRFERELRLVPRYLDAPNLTTTKASSEATEAKRKKSGDTLGEAVSFLTPMVWTPAEPPMPHTMTDSDAENVECELRLRLLRLRFSDLALFSAEHTLVARIRESLRELQQRERSHRIEALESRIRGLAVHLKDREFDMHSCLELEPLRNRALTVLSLLKQRRELDRERRRQWSLFTRTYLAWQELVRLRKEQGWQSTSLSLKVRRRADRLLDLEKDEQHQKNEVQDALHLKSLLSSSSKSEAESLLESEVSEEIEEQAMCHELKHAIARLCQEEQKEEEEEDEASDETKAKRAVLILEDLFGESDDSLLLVEQEFDRAVAKVLLQRRKAPCEAVAFCGVDRRSFGASRQRPLRLLISSKATQVSEAVHCTLDERERRRQVSRLKVALRLRVDERTVWHSPLLPLRQDFEINFNDFECDDVSLRCLRKQRDSLRVEMQLVLYRGWAFLGTLSNGAFGGRIVDSAAVAVPQSETSQLQQLSFHGAKLGEAKLGEAKLSEAKLSEAKLGEINFDEAKLGECVRRECADLMLRLQWHVPKLSHGAATVSHTDNWPSQVQAETLSKFGDDEDCADPRLRLSETPVIDHDRLGDRSGGQSGGRSSDWSGGPRGQACRVSALAPSLVLDTVDSFRRRVLSVRHLVRADAGETPSEMAVPLRDCDIDVAVAETVSLLLPSARTQNETDCQKTHREELQREAQRRLMLRSAVAQDARQLVCEQALPDVPRLLATALLRLFAPHRALRPTRETRTLVAAASRVRLIVQVVDAQNLPTRKSGATRPFVEVVFGRAAAKTAICCDEQIHQWHEVFAIDVGDALDKNVEWTPTLLAQRDASVRLSVYDAVESTRGDVLRRGATVRRCERRWLGSAHVPLSVLLTRVSVDGRFALQSAFFTRDGLLPPSLRCFLTLDPPLVHAMPAPDDDDDFSMEETDDLMRLDTLALLCRRFKRRTGVNARARLAGGKRALVCRFVRSLAPPKRFEIGACVRFVSVIPFKSDLSVSRGTATDVWCTPKQFLQLGLGDWEEHAILLCAFLRHFDETRGNTRDGECGHTCLLLGQSMPHGDAAFVLRRRIRRSLATEIPEVLSVSIYDAVTGRRFDAGDSAALALCSLCRVDAVVDAQQIYANTQRTSDISALNWSLEDRTLWTRLFDRADEVPVSELTSLVTPSVEWTRPRKIQQSKERIFELERIIENRFENWRSRALAKYGDGQVETTWDMAVSRVLRESLRRLENVAQQQANLCVQLGASGVKTQNDELQRIRDTFGDSLVSYALCVGDCGDGSVEERMLAAVRQTGLHETARETARFARAVHVHPYPNGFSAVWFYIAVILE